MLLKCERNIGGVACTINKHARQDILYGAEQTDERTVMRISEAARDDRTHAAQINKRASAVRPRPPP